MDPSSKERTAILALHERRRFLNMVVEVILSMERFLWQVSLKNQ